LVIAFLLLFVLPFTVEAATYYVGKSGSDANSCATATSPTAGNRKLTIGSGRACLAGGDTLVVGNGDWDERIVSIPNGTSGAPTIVKSENFRLAVVKSSGQPVAVSITGSWIVLRDFKVDDVNAPTDSTHAVLLSNCSNIIIDGIEATSAVRSGISVDRTCDTVTVTRVWSHDNGRPPELLPGNGVYAQGSNITVELSILEGNRDAGITGVEPAFGPKTGSIVRHNIIRNNSKYGISTRGSVFNGTGGIRHNLIYGNSTVSSGFAAILIGSGGSLVYNNTIFNNNAKCVSIAFGTTSTVRNNICHANNPNTITEDSVGNTISNNTTANPNFTNQGANDLTLTVGSTGQIRQGINVGLPINCGTTPDIGAFQTSNCP
jgi:hypothetical protein